MVRVATARDSAAAANLLSAVLAAQQREEFTRQLKLLFSHPALWLASALLIVVIGIPLDLPVAAVSGFVFMLMFFINKVHQLQKMFINSRLDKPDHTKIFMHGLFVLRGGSDGSGRPWSVSTTGGRLRCRTRWITTAGRTRRCWWPWWAAS